LDAGQDPEAQAGPIPVPDDVAQPGAGETSLDPAPSSATEPVLDPAALENLLSVLGGEFSYLEELIDSFLEDAPQLLNELGQFIAGGDVGGATRVAHSLKSNGADFGAITFTQLCKELETQGRAGEMDGAAGLLAQIEAEYGRMAAALLDIQRESRLPA
jgi:HPt (histidine-containing phosphotransfer) domain-containing protein